MQIDRPVTRRLFTVRNDLLRGDSLFAAMVFIVVALFLFNLAASLWNNVVFQKDMAKRAGVRNAKAVGSVLAKAAETLMAADELSLLRRTVAEAGIEHSLRTCRVILPDGGVVADADPAGISAIQLPPSWEELPTTYSEEFLRRTARFVFPLSVPGRGTATLEIAASTGDAIEASLGAQTAQMAVACLALASMLLVHRHARFRLKAIGAIHEILLAVKDDRADMSSLELDPSLGLEAVAWNKLLGEKQSMQVSSAIQQVKEAVHEKSETAEILAGAFNSVCLGLIVVNDRMKIEHINGAAATLLQADQKALLQTGVFDILKDPCVTTAVCDAATNPASKRVTIEVERGGPAAQDVLRFTVAPVKYGHVHFCLIAIEDITQHRVAEAAMNSFLAKAAHELRTPLTNIRLFVEEVLEHCERDPAATSHGLNIINEETQRLDRTVGEILSASQIEAGSFELKRDDVRMDELLRQLKADHEAQAHQKGIALEFELPPKLPVLHVDRDKIALVLHNLVGNALKYTLSGGRIVVTPSLEPGRLIVAVTDTGLGIGPDETERVFEKFYRSQNPLAANVKGSGLGLAIAREVARLHGGDVTLDSELGKGSTFTLILPIAEEGK